MRWLGALCGLAVFAAGCEGEHRAAIAPQAPPTPATWPAYPHFPQHSCWTRPSSSATRVLRSAPSYFSARHGKATPPAAIVRRVLARFGDRTYVRGIKIGAPPPRSKLKGFFPGERPPGDALWAYIDAPYAEIGPVIRPSAAEIAARIRAQWEVELIGGALRDDFCRAGGRSLAGWSIGGEVRGVSDAVLGQRFPNPSPKAFHRRVNAVGKRYGFRLASLRLLRPRQLAPMLVVETSRDRKKFVRDVPAIMSLLDPSSGGRGQTAITFEGFFFEARDDRGAFFRFMNAYRGVIMGGEWSWDRCVYAYPGLGAVNAQPRAPCPQD